MGPIYAHADDIVNRYMDLILDYIAHCELEENEALQRRERAELDTMGRIQ